MFAVPKLFSREFDEAAETAMDSRLASIDEMRTEYRACILAVLSKAGIDFACLDLDIRHGGKAADGRDIFTAMIRISRWDRASGLRLLLGLPMLERGARRLLGASWVTEASHFGGLWLHPSRQILDSALLKELGLDLASLEGLAAPFQRDESRWSLPSESEFDRKATDWGAV